MYEPVSSVTALRLRPVSVWLTVTSTPGKTAPDESLIVPLICAVDCAEAAKLMMRVRNNAGRIFLLIRLTQVHFGTFVFWPLIHAPCGLCTKLVECRKRHASA